MAFKQFEVADIGTITVYKRRDARSIRLSVDHNNKVKVTMPIWAPYAAGVNFAKAKRAWLLQQLASQAKQLLAPGSSVGKQHRLLYVAKPGAQVRSRATKAGVIIIRHDTDQTWQDSAVQAVAERAAIRALRTEAEDTLPGRLQALAAKHGFRYRSVAIRQLKSRWGSCDQDQNITLNLYLMQLPWHLIDYVLLHELTHTNVMQHGPTFWAAMERVEPNTAQHRKEMREYRTILSQ